MQLFTVDGSLAIAAVPTTLSAAGLQERGHLQEWVIAHPEVVGSQLRVVATEYDRWQGTDGVTARDRLDVLALEASGRLVVVELKRDEDRDVHLQAITYAALVSRFTPDTLAEAHAAWLTRRGTPTTVADAAALLEAHLVDGWDDELLLRPRIVLLANKFSRTVTHSVVWLSQMGLDVTLVRGLVWTVGSPPNWSTIVAFDQLYPTPEIEEFTLAPGRQETARATGRAEERVRAANTVRRLVDAGLLDDGAPLTLVPVTASTEEREAIAAWIDEQPERGRAIWHNDPVSPIVWEADGKPWRATTLARAILGRAGLPERAVRGPSWWQTDAGIDLASLAEGLSGTGRRDWSDLHRLLAAIPAGRWTTYGDLADAIGTHANPLGQHLTNCVDCTNAHRVLNRLGKVASNFRWADATRSAPSPRDLLEQEGVSFDPVGVADASRRLSPATLSTLNDDHPGKDAPTGPRPVTVTAARVRVGDLIALPGSYEIFGNVLRVEPLGGQDVRLLVSPGDGVAEQVDVAANSAIVVFPSP